jgi:hypothetical protein
METLKIELSMAPIGLLYQKVTKNHFVSGSAPDFERESGKDLAGEAESNC